MSSSAIRAFVGLKLPEHLSSHLNELAAVLSPQDRGQMSWVAEENYHVTLLFLGEQSARWLEDLAEKMDSDVDLHAPQLSLTGVTPFPESSPKLLAAMLEPTDSLQRLHNQIKAAANALGFVPEKRRFRPHVTLARKFPRSGQLMIPTLSNKVYDEATQLLIYESQLSPSGAQYYPLFEFDLF